MSEPRQNEGVARIRVNQVAAGRLEDAGVFPNVVVIDTCSYCNLRCSMCAHPNMTRPRGAMEWDLFTKVVDEIAEKNPGARVWMVFFGEALVLKNREPSIFEMIRYAKDAGLQDVVLNTNAQLLDARAAGRLIDSGLDCLYVGMDAVDAETYAKIRVGGELSTATRNLDRLLELKSERGANHPAVFVQFIQMELNEGQIDRFREVWGEKDVTVKIRPKVSWAGLVDAPDQVLGQEERWPCYWAMQLMAIAHDGRVVLCGVDLDARFVAGDVGEQTLSEIWDGRLREIRSLHLSGRFEELPELCRDCRDWQSARAQYYESMGDR